MEIDKWEGTGDLGQRKDHRIKIKEKLWWACQAQPNHELSQSSKQITWREKYLTQKVTWLA